MVLAVASVPYACTRGGRGQEIRREAIPSTLPSSIPSTKASGPAGILGVVRLIGAPPSAKPIVSAGPGCPKPLFDPWVRVGSSNGLRDVVVRIAPSSFDHPPPVVTGPTHALVQEGCVISPHVLAIRAGDPVQFLNADPTLHNFHVFDGDETELNFGQPSGAPGVTRPISSEPHTFRVTCDVHPWTTAYVVATDHPFFTVTDDDGHFAIAGVPARTYTLQAFHPALGDRSTTVVVPAGGNVEVDFSYEPLTP